MLPLDLFMGGFFFLAEEQFMLCIFLILTQYILSALN